MLVGWNLCWLGGIYAGWVESMLVIVLVFCVVFFVVLFGFGPFLIGPLVSLILIFGPWRIVFHVI